jgi:hypothetical protein
MINKFTPESGLQKVREQGLGSCSCLADETPRRIKKQSRTPPDDKNEGESPLP